uniref:Uncharacterized protein n=1 Tax=Salix viminalis TaxID=40686 RepID=A0A6N2KQI3_SALVM
MVAEGSTSQNEDEWVGANIVESIGAKLLPSFFGGAVVSRGVFAAAVEIARRRSVSSSPPLPSLSRLGFGVLLKEKIVRAGFVVAKMLTGDIPPNQRIYIKNPNEKVKKEEGVYDPNAKKKKKQEGKGEYNEVAISTF